MDTKHYTFKEGLCALVKPDGVHCLYRQGSEKDSYVVRYTFDYNEGAFKERKCARLPNGSVLYSREVPAKFDPQLKEEGFVLDTVLPLAKALTFDEAVEKVGTGKRLAIYSHMTRDIRIGDSLKGFFVETQLYDMTITRETFNNYNFYEFF